MTNLDIESLFGADLYAKGEELLRDGAISDAILLEKDKYQLFINDGKQYEVSLENPFSKNTKSQCECSFYNEHFSCKHIVAAFLHILNISPSKLKSAPTQRKVTVKSLLHQIDEEALKLFIISYASKDKKFSNAIKLHFIRKIDIEDNDEKYKVILNSIIKPVSSKNPSLKITELKQFQTIIADLLEQAQDAIALKEYLEAYYILSNVLYKIHYVDHHYDEHSQTMTVASKDYIVSLMHLIQEKKLAPDLRKQIGDFVKDLIQKSYFHPRTPLLNAVQVYMMLRPDQSQWICEIALRKVATAESIEEKEAWYVLLFVIRANLNLANPFEVTNDFLPRVHEVVNVLRLSHHEIALHAAIHFFNQHPNDLVFLSTLLEFYDDLEDVERFVDVAATAFAKTQNVKIIDLVKRFEEEVYIEKIRERMQDLIKPKTRPQQKAAMFAKVEDWSSLMQLMYEIKDISILTQYDKPLYNSFPKELIYLYVDLVDEYLEKHIGTYAHTYIHELSHHLTKSGMKKVLKEVESMINTKYSHRSKINNDLM